MLKHIRCRMEVSGQRVVRHPTGGAHTLRQADTV
jgi:hypothetical protein